MARIAWVFLLAVACFVSLAAAAAPTFCKCTCFKNSTIIPLGSDHEQRGLAERSLGVSAWTGITGGFDFGAEASAEAVTDADTDTEKPAKRAASSSCSQCNRAFCLEYNLPICKDAEEKDVVALCFQRDSRKDQIIVWCFILGTAGLLGWTAIQKIREVRAARATTRQPLLPDRGATAGSFIQRAASSVGLDMGSRGPLASPGAADTGPRGQYAPLGGSAN